MERQISAVQSAPPCVQPNCGRGFGSFFSFELVWAQHSSVRYENGHSISYDWCSFPLVVLLVVTARVCSLCLLVCSDPFGVFFFSGWAEERTEPTSVTVVQSSPTRSSLICRLAMGCNSSAAKVSDRGLGDGRSGRARKRTSQWSGAPGSLLSLCAAHTDDAAANRARVKRRRRRSEREEQWSGTHSAHADTGRRDIRMGTSGRPLSATASGPAASMRWCRVRARSRWATASEA